MQIFRNEEFGQVRGIQINEEGWLVGKDVARILGYSNASDALKTHVDKEDKKQIAFHDLQKVGLSDFGTKGGILISESGLYSLILSSKLPGVKKFRR